MTTDAATRQMIDSLIEEGDRLVKRYGDDMPETEKARLSAINEHITSLVGDSKLKDEFQSLSRWVKAPTWQPPMPGGGVSGERGVSGKSLGEQFVSSDTFKHHDPMRKVAPSSELEMKTLLDQTGFVPQAIRTDVIMPGVLQAPTLLDFILTGQTSQSSVVYMEETTTTNAAAEAAEGAAKAESAIAFTERTSAVRTIATVLPVTNQLLEDVKASRDYIDNRLATFVRRRLETQLITGNGTAPNLRGILNTSGIQTQAKGADPTPDTIAKAMDLVRVGGAEEPDAVVLHPTDWQEIKLLRAADGTYLWGAPAQQLRDSIWGLPVIITTAITQNTGLVGAFRSAAQLFYRTGLQVAISDSHSDFFIRNQQMIRAEIRAALAVFRPAAFCQITGI